MKNKTVGTLLVAAALITLVVSWFDSSMTAEISISLFAIFALYFFIKKSN